MLTVVSFLIDIKFFKIHINKKLLGTIKEILEPSNSLVTRL